MTFLWAFQLSPVPKQASWTLSLLCSSAAADYSCISGNTEVYFKNFLLFSAMGAFCDAAVLIHWQGRMKTRTNHVSVWLCVCSGGVSGYPLQCVLHCLTLSLNVQACASMHIFLQVWMCVFVRNAGLLCMFIFWWNECVFSHCRPGWSCFSLDRYSRPVQAAHGMMW